MIETPQGFVVDEECRKAAWQNGYRRPLEEEAGWAQYGSTTAKGTIYLSATGPSGPWFLALDHTGVVEELEHSRADMPGPGVARYAFATLTELYAVLPKAYVLGVALPEAPLEDFPRRNAQPAKDHRGRAPRRSAYWPGHLSRPPADLLAGPLPLDRNQGTETCCAPRTSFPGRTAPTMPNG